MTKNEDLKSTQFFINERHDEVDSWIEIHEHVAHSTGKARRFVCEFISHDRKLAMTALDALNLPTIAPTDRRKNKRCEGRNACGGCYPAVCLETDGYERARKAAQDSTTDGDAERALDNLLTWCRAKFTDITHEQINHEGETIRTALQSTRKQNDKLAKLRYALQITKRDIKNWYPDSEARTVMLDGIEKTLKETADE